LGDALGDAYEYLIGQFAAGGGKKAGEFYTPKQVSNILSRIVSLISQRIAMINVKFIIFNPVQQHIHPR
jgi:type I restriction enzyme M protein